MRERISAGVDKLKPSTGRGRTAWIIGAVVLVILVLYYPVGMMLTHTIDDDTEFRAPAELDPDAGSHAVAMAAFTGFVFQLHEHKFVDTFYQKIDFTVSMFESFLNW